MIAPGTKVDIYWNLHKDVFSVRSRERDNYGIVIAHVDSFTLMDVQFVVSENGRQKVLREKRKNVHAFVRGVWAKPGSHEAFTGLVSRVSYNPYKGPHFIAHAVTLTDTREVERADMAYGQVQYNNPLLFGYWE